MGIVRLGINILVFLVLSGCFSQIPRFDTWARDLIGMHIEDLREINNRKESYAARIGWKEKTYRLENGNLVYVFPDSKNCLVHTEINDQGVVIGYWPEGYCR